MIDIPVRCGRCHKIVVVEVPEQGYRAWISGQMIQDAMPEVTANDRELLISKTCKQCFAKLFKEENE